MHYSVYQFPIHQSDYHDTDWQFALGTFGAMWEPLIPKYGLPVGVLCRSNVGDDWIDEGTMALTHNNSATRKLQASCTGQSTQAKVWGTKIWRWHSDTDRASVKVHQAAYRLVQSGMAAQISPLANRIVDIRTGQPTL